MFEPTRRRVLEGLRRRYIYGCLVRAVNAESRWTSKLTIVIFNLQPLLHTIVLLIEMAVTMRLASRFNAFYAERPGEHAHCGCKWP